MVKELVSTYQKFKYRSTRKENQGRDREKERRGKDFNKVKLCTHTTFFAEVDDAHLFIQYSYFHDSF